MPFKQYKAFQKSGDKIPSMLTTTGITPILEKKVFFKAKDKQPQMPSKHKLSSSPEEQKKPFKRSKSQLEREQSQREEKPFQEAEWD